jgi:hypothetical protein
MICKLQTIDSSMWNIFGGSFVKQDSMLLWHVCQEETRVAQYPKKQQVHAQTLMEE